MTLRYRAIIEYDGGDFLGFQLQAQGRTVQGVLENAIERVTRQPCRVIGAGRTDSGVHASGQVIAFNNGWRHTVEDLQRALNASLPADVAVRELAVAEADFHPRFDALRRQYRYTVINRPVREPLNRRYAHQVYENLDVGAMQAASDCLVGSHDFAAFGKPPQGNVTIRRVDQAQWKIEREYLFFEITANAFLNRMVRNIVGTLLRVGVGALEPEAVRRLLETGDRRTAGPAAPAQGLCLVRIDYAD